MVLRVTNMDYQVGQDTTIYDTIDGRSHRMVNGPATLEVNLAFYSDGNENMEAVYEAMINQDGEAFVRALLENMQEPGTAVPESGPPESEPGFTQQVPTGKRDVKI